MRIAITKWQGRVSPVFDVAGEVLLVEKKQGAAPVFQGRSLQAEDMFTRVQSLKDWKVDVLLCGSISRPMENALIKAGIKVIPFICGEIDMVLEAFWAGCLGQKQYLMPGCCNNPRRLRGKGRRQNLGFLSGPNRGCRPGRPRQGRNK